MDVYHKVGTDMIMNKTISGVNGITNYKINAGDMNNSGVEFSLAGHLIQDKDFGLNLSFNYGFNVNRLVRADTSLGSISVSQKLSGSALIKESLSAPSTHMTSPVLTTRQVCLYSETRMALTHGCPTESSLPITRSMSPSSAL